MVRSLCVDIVPYKTTAVMCRDSLIVMNITARIPIHNQATAHSPCLSNGSNGSFNTTNISGKYETESTEAMNPTTSLWSLFQCRNINPFKFTLLLHFNYGFRSLSPEKHSHVRCRTLLQEGDTKSVAHINQTLSASRNSIDRLGF
jgi:hypothetical protein